MYRTWLIFKHYFIRGITDYIGLCFLVILPVGMVALNVVAFGGAEKPIVDGYNILATLNAFMIMIMFQFFGGMYINEWIHEDFRGTRRWRLFSAPVSQNRFFFTAAAASWAITIAQGLFLIIVSVIFFDIYIGNFIFWVPVMFLLAAITQVMYIIIGSFTKKKKTAETIGYIIIFGMSIMAGVALSFGERITEILQKIPTPFNAAVRAVFYSGLESEFHEINTRVAAENLLILAAILAVLVIIAALLGKRRRKA